MNIGIIAEYNPFHYGHLYHINKIKEMYPDCNIILVTSGLLTQRGDLSIIDNFDKAKIALEYGVDLILELPIKYIDSADYFAMGTLKILNLFKIDKLVFGSECDDINKIKKLASAQVNNVKLDNMVKDYINKGLNYPNALSKSLESITNIKIDTPNDLLGISYVKEIIKNNYNIEPITIKRTTDYNNKNIEGKITSATSIRELLKHNKDISKYVPNSKYINNIFLDDYFSLLKYKIITEDNLTIYKGIDEKLENRIKKYIINSSSLEELIQSIKTKSYTYNRIKRALLFILLNIKKDNLDLDYVRVLGFNKEGKKILNSIKKEINIPILTNYDPKYLDKYLSIRKVLSLNDKIKDKKYFIEKEYKEKPIIKD